MTKFSSFFRGIGGSIAGAFHKGTKRSRKSSQANCPNSPPRYDDLFGPSAQSPTVQERSSDTDSAAQHGASSMRIAHDPTIHEHSSGADEGTPQEPLLDRMAHGQSSEDHVPVVSSIYSMSPQVTIPVSQVRVEPRETTPPPYQQRDVSANVESAEDTADPFLHLVEEAIAAQSPQSRVVGSEQEPTHLEETIAANPAHRSRADTGRSSSDHYMSSNIPEDIELPPRAVSSPEPRAGVSRIPHAVRASSSQARSAIPIRSSSRPEAAGTRPVLSQSTAREHFGSSSIQPRAVSAPQSASQSHTRATGGHSGTQATSTRAIPDTIQRHPRNSAHHANLVRASENAERQSALRRQRPHLIVDEDESDELTGEENPLQIEDFLARDRAVARNVRHESRRVLSSGDLNTLRLQHGPRRDTASRGQAAHNQNGHSNETIPRTEDGNRRSNIHQGTHNHGADRSSSSQYHGNNDLDASDSRSGRELAHSDRSRNSNSGMDSETRERNTNFSRPRPSEGTRPLPAQSDPIHPGITSPLLIAELRHGRAHGTTRPPVIGQHLADRLDAARTERGLPRSPRMWNIPTPDDEINNPIHPGDFRDDGYHPNNRDPDSHAERLPARENRVVHGQYRPTSVRNQIIVDSHNRLEAMKRERELQELREQERQRAIREMEERRREERERQRLDRERRAREKREREQRARAAMERRRGDAVDGMLQPVHIDRCFCLEEFEDGGEPHERVKLEHCSHVFGRSCIKEWLMNNTTCPICIREHPRLAALTEEERQRLRLP